METDLKRNDIAAITYAELTQEVIRIIGEHTTKPVEDIALGDDLYLDLGYDSLEDVELIMELEEELDIDVPDDLAQALSKVGAIVDGLAKLLGIAPA